MLTKIDAIIAGNTVNINVIYRLFLPRSNFHDNNSAVIYFNGIELIAALIIRENIKQALPIYIK